jgi:hypothetical protein
VYAFVEGGGKGVVRQTKAGQLMRGISVQLGALWNRYSRSLSDQTEMSYQFRTQTTREDSRGMVAREWMGRNRRAREEERHREERGE